MWGPSCGNVRGDSVVCRDRTGSGIGLGLISRSWEVYNRNPSEAGVLCFRFADQGFEF